jgi:tight adherence protein B
MTAAEYALFAGGGACFLLFLHRTLAPFFRARLDRTAGRTAAQLREELLFCSQSQVRYLLMAACALPAAAATLAAGSVALGIALGTVPAFLSGFAVRHFRRRRHRRIALQLPGFLEVLAGHVQAGHSLPEALQDSIPLLPRGIREEVSWIRQSVRVGTSLPDALSMWERRVPCEEVSLLVRPLRIALETGSNVADLLARCREILQAKLLMEGKLRSMTAQSRLQAAVLTLLPFGFIAVLSRIDPAYLPRCLGTPPGIAILAAAAILQAAGWLVIRRIMTARG